MHNWRGKPNHKPYPIYSNCTIWGYQKWKPQKVATFYRSTLVNLQYSLVLSNVSIDGPHVGHWRRSLRASACLSGLGMGDCWSCWRMVGTLREKSNLVTNSSKNGVWLQIQRCLSSFSWETIVHKLGRTLQFIAIIHREYDDYRWILGEGLWRHWRRDPRG